MLRRALDVNLRHSAALPSRLTQTGRIPLGHGLRSINASRPAIAPSWRRSTVSRDVRRPFHGSHSPFSRQSTIQAGDQTFTADDWTNTPDSILGKIPRRLHDLQNHPISILRNLIESHFATEQSLKAITPSSPIVTTQQNFDELGFAPDHPGRSMTDSYYLNARHMLRTHTSAHEVETFRAGNDRWLLSADVYRRDEIDSSHYPVFHQMEGARVWSQEVGRDALLAALRKENARLQAELERCPIAIEDETRMGDSNPLQPCHDPEIAAEIAQHLKHSLNGLIFHLFGRHAKGAEATKGEPLKVRWIEAFFPFTTPSYEVEVFWNDEWLEILGSGVVMQKTLETAGVPHKTGWAFGLGLERIAMILFSIPDIRLFWSEDERFLSQFKEGSITTFRPYSRYPPCYKDVSFWTSRASERPGEVGAKAAGGAWVATEGGVKAFHENDFCEVVRDVAGDLVEDVKLIDDFLNKKTGRTSKCYRINYRSMDRSLSNEEVNKLQSKVLERLTQTLDIELR